MDRRPRVFDLLWIVRHRISTTEPKEKNKAKIDRENKVFLLLFETIRAARHCLDKFSIEKFSSIRVYILKREKPLFLPKKRKSWRTFAGVDFMTDFLRPADGMNQVRCVMNPETLSGFLEKKEKSNCDSFFAAFRFVFTDIFIINFQSAADLNETLKIDSVWTFSRNFLTTSQIFPTAMFETRNLSITSTNMFRLNGQRSDIWISKRKIELKLRPKEKSTIFLLFGENYRATFLRRLIYWWETFSNLFVDVRSLFVIEFSIKTQIEREKQSNLFLLRGGANLIPFWPHQPTLCTSLWHKLHQKSIELSSSNPS